MQQRLARNALRPTVAQQALALCSPTIVACSFADSRCLAAPRLPRDRFAYTLYSRHASLGLYCAVQGAMQHKMSAGARMHPDAGLRQVILSFQAGINHCQCEFRLVCAHRCREGVRT
eukprot:909309-Alexandrium_andersonii.AAC.1